MDWFTKGPKIVVIIIFLDYSHIHLKIEEHLYFCTFPVLPSTQSFITSLGTPKPSKGLSSLTTLPAGN